jgi:hypothetical protein
MAVAAPETRGRELDRITKSAAPIWAAPPGRGTSGSVA